MRQAKIRLYVEHPLGQGKQVALDPSQANYLFSVMRLKPGDPVAVFNGRDGEWFSEVIEGAKKRGTLGCIEQSKPLRLPPDLWLAFAPIKKARTDFIVEKATELGASRILPIQTQFTNSDRIRQDRLQAHAIEAAEQCGGTYVPEVVELAKLRTLLETWDPDRHILFCDESRVGDPVGDLRVMPQGPWAIFIGPEGGFSDDERRLLLAMPNVQTISLGPRILRADTAAVAALTLWQNALGDWE